MLEEIFTKHGADFVEDLKQSDTYFFVQRGRLKLRENDNGNLELIFYERDESSPAGMLSNYEIFRHPDLQLKELLIKALGVKTIVEKERRLLKFENARIHLDSVKSLGDFLEFEIVSEGDNPHDAILLDILKRLASPFVLSEVNQSYSDLRALPGDIGTV